MNVCERVRIRVQVRTCEYVCERVRTCDCFLVGQVGITANNPLSLKKIQFFLKNEKNDKKGKKKRIFLKVY